MQNLHYTYDPAGNITHIRDDAQQTIYFSNQRVEPSNDYIYDALYRLIQADGREHLGQDGALIPHSARRRRPRRARCHPGDGNAMGTYIERYVYDAVGNFLQMQHRGSDPAHAGWTRGYDYLEPSLIEDGSAAHSSRPATASPAPQLNPAAPLPQIETYQHDAHGNMVRMPHLGGGTSGPNMHWDYKDQLRQIDLGGGGTAYYVYDASGQRVRKVWEKAPGLTEERIYLGGFELFRRHSGPIGGGHRHAGTRDAARHGRRAAHRPGGDPHARHGRRRHRARQLIRYQFGNHLGSASLELDDQAQIISYEEYTPYGSSTYQAVRSQTETAKRYRYTGKERDEETGLNYHGARYYAVWLGRWISCDSIGLEGGINLYRYAACAPTSFQDPTGTNPQPPLTVKEQAAIAETAGQEALVKKYSAIDTVTNITPSKDVSANGVDAHLIVGKGDRAINVIGDTKFAGPEKDGGLAPENYSGKEVAGRVSSFDAAAKNNYAQLVRNIEAAQRAGTIDAATAYHAIEGAKAGLVLHEIVVSGRTTGVTDAIVQNYQASVTRVDNFAETTAIRQSLDVKAALGKNPGRVPSLATLNRWWTKAFPGGAAKPPATPPAEVSKPPTVTPPEEPPGMVVKQFGGMPGTMTLDPAPKGVGGVGLTVLVTFGPDIAVDIAKKAGASETVVEQVGFWSSVGAGAAYGAAMGAPADGIGAGPGALLGGAVGGVGYLSKHYELCLPFYNCSD